MNLQKYELKKVLLSPVFLILTITFLIYNTLIILEQSHVKGEFQTVNQIADVTGTNINSDMIKKFDAYYNQNLDATNKILATKGYDKTTNINDFLQTLPFDKQEEFTEQELKSLINTAIIEDYYYSLDTLESNYKNIDILELGKDTIKLSPFNDKVNSIMLNDYAKFSERFENILSSNEYKSLAPSANTTSSNKFLFGTLFKTMLYELIILIVLATAYITNFEFFSKTSHITYSSKRGRKLVYDKLFASLYFSGIISTIIIGISLAIYFIIFDYSKIYNSSISSYFLQEFNKHPYLSWWDLSILEYTILVVIFSFILMSLIALISFVLSIFIRNSYIVFGCFILIFGFNIILPILIPNSSNLMLLSVYNPFALISSMPYWFMLKSALALNTFKHYELTILIIWGLILTISSYLSIKNFKRKDIL